MKSAFLSPLCVEQISEDGNGIWQLRDPLRYASALLNGIISAEKGFVTDFASVPRLPFAWMLAGGVANRAAVIHDLLYQCGNVAREVADSVFLEAMEVLGVGWFRRRAMFMAVRCFGGSSKKNNITLKLREFTDEENIICAYADDSY
jgi:hypothetical protein